MKTIDLNYQKKTGLTQRKYYSIFYSKLQESPIMIIGYNPGGNPDIWNESQLASKSFYENGEHEYVDCHYSLAVGTRNFIMRVLDLKDSEPIRSIPKTNIIFRRSVNQDKLKLTPTILIDESKEFLEEIIKYVNPDVIIFEGKTTLDKFNSKFCSTTTKSFDNSSVFTPNGKYDAQIYRADRSYVNCLQKEIICYYSAAILTNNC